MYMMTVELKLFLPCTANELAVQCLLIPVGDLLVGLLLCNVASTMPGTAKSHPFHSILPAHVVSSLEYKFRLSNFILTSTARSLSGLGQLWPW